MVETMTKEVEEGGHVEKEVHLRVSPRFFPCCKFTWSIILTIGLVIFNNAPSIILDTEGLIPPPARGGEGGPCVHPFSCIILINGLLSFAYPMGIGVIFVIVMMCIEEFWMSEGDSHWKHVDKIDRYLSKKIFKTERWSVIWCFIVWSYILYHIIYPSVVTGRLLDFFGTNTDNVVTLDLLQKSMPFVVDNVYIFYIFHFLCCLVYFVVFPFLNLE